MWRRRDSGTPGQDQARQGARKPAAEQIMLDRWRQTACYSLTSTDYQGDSHADNSGFVKGATIETVSMQDTQSAH
jgi:hypothetical protein